MQARGGVNPTCGRPCDTPALAMPLHLAPATPADVPAITALRAAVAADLTSRYGKGHWSAAGTEKGVLFDLRTPGLYVARDGEGIFATLRLATRKPWAIDRSYFSPCRRPLYLASMAVAPARQRQGIGRLSMVEAERIAREWPAEAIFLDAYDAAAGAGEFYRKCGFREVARVSYRSTPLVYLERLLQAAARQAAPGPPG
jgi:GNAT superfamily N-acetyltransferase